MTNQEHRIPVDNGRYTFLVPEGDYKIVVLRDGVPWSQQTQSHGAIHALMCELDAARVVVTAVRQLVDGWQGNAQASLGEVLKQHDGLVADRSPPSPWTGGLPEMSAPSTSCQNCKYGIRRYLDESTGEWLHDLDVGGGRIVCNDQCRVKLDCYATCALNTTGCCAKHVLVTPRPEIQGVGMSVEPKILSELQES